MMGRQLVVVNMDELGLFRGRMRSNIAGPLMMESVATPQTARPGVVNSRQDLLKYYEHRALTGGCRPDRLGLGRRGACL